MYGGLKALAQRSGVASPCTPLSMVGHIVAMRLFRRTPCPAWLVCSAVSRLPVLCIVAEVLGNGDAGGVLASHVYTAVATIVATLHALPGCCAFLAVTVWMWACAGGVLLQAQLELLAVCVDDAAGLFGRGCMRDRTCCLHGLVRAVLSKTQCMYH